WPRAPCTGASQPRSSTNTCTACSSSSEERSRESYALRTSVRAGRARSWSWLAALAVHGTTLSAAWHHGVWTTKLPGVWRTRSIVRVQTGGCTARETNAYPLALGDGHGRHCIHNYQRDEGRAPQPWTHRGRDRTAHSGGGAKNSIDARPARGA